MNVLDRNKDGSLDYSEFLSGFTISSGADDDAGAAAAGGPV